MSNQAKPGASGKSQLVRPRFSPGLLLQDDDLTSAVDYTTELSRLMFRSLFGCGVVCGLTVTLHNKNHCKATIQVAPGLALDGHGDPVQLTSAQTIPFDQVSGQLWVVISRTVTQCQRREIACSADDDAADSVSTRLHDGFKISLYNGAEAPTGACGCAPLKVAEKGDDPATEHAKCYAQHTAGLCSCDCHTDLVVLGLIPDLAAALDAAGTDAYADSGVMADHSVRRFISPALMNDPLLPMTVAVTVKSPQQAIAAATTTAQAAATAAAAARSAAAENERRLTDAGQAIAKLKGVDADAARAALQSALDSAHVLSAQGQAAEDSANQTAAALHALLTQQ